MKYTQGTPWTASIIPTVPNRKSSFILFSLLILMILLSASCRSGGEGTERETKTAEEERITALMADLSPKDGKLLFFAAVTRQQHRERELEECRREAAAQLSRYHAFNGVNFTLTMNRTNSTMSVEGGEIAYNSDLADSLMKDLVLEEEIRTEEGTCALFSFKPDDLPLFPFKPEWKTSPPEWTQNALKLKGFRSAVGITGPGRFLARTIQQADRNALTALLEESTGTVSTVQKDNRNSRGSSSESDVTVRASGTVRNAYIISRWQDEKGNMYSLVLRPLGRE